MKKNKGRAVVGALIGGFVSNFGAGCSDRRAVAERDALVDRGAMVEMGELRLALETDTNERFRLVNASFEVRDSNGAVAVTLNSGNDAGVSLEAQLPQGDYVIELLGGWALEGHGAETSVVQAALVTRNPSVFQIQHGQVTDLAFVFATSSGKITLGEGEVEVGIDVVNGKTLEQCDLLNGASCPEGQTCLLALGNRRTFCATPGVLEVGAECDSEQCVAGAQCLATAPVLATAQGPATTGDGGTTRTCKRFCDPDTEFPLCDCHSLSDDDTVGVCAGPATCEPNCLLPSTLTYFDDYYSDDIAATGIQTFFEGLRGVTSSSYILMAVDRPGSLWGAWCSSNADFYLQSYLSLSSNGGNVYSGAWEKYYRTEGGVWSDAVYDAYPNYFGASCGGPYSWCSEMQLGNNVNLYPAGGSYELESSISGATVNITVGPTRQSTCGF